MTRFRCSKVMKFFQLIENVCFCLLIGNSSTRHITITWIRCFRTVRWFFVIFKNFSTSNHPKSWDWEKVMILCSFQKFIKAWLFYYPDCFIFHFNNTFRLKMIHSSISFHQRKSHSFLNNTWKVLKNSADKRNRL